MKRFARPEPGEYAPYAIAYIDLVPEDGLLLDHLQTNLEKAKQLARSFPEEKLTWRFAAGEWTIKEILGHIMDTERILVYRALRFARNDSTELPGFEQDDYVPYSHANERSLDDILDEYSAVRMASIALFKSLDDSAWLRAGMANKHNVTVRALAYQVVGHELHHLNSIKQNYG